MSLPDNPISRNEQYLAAIAGQEVELPDYPITREEQYLAYIAENGGGGLTPEQETKLDKALVSPETAPTEKELVGVGTGNEQIMFKVGDGLEIDGETSPFTLKASGGSGGGTCVYSIRYANSWSIPMGDFTKNLTVASIEALFPSGMTWATENPADSIIAIHTDSFYINIFAFRSFTPNTDITIAGHSFIDGTSTGDHYQIFVVLKPAT